MSDPRLADLTILIVDDDEDILAGMALTVRAEGATVLTATDGNAAVSVYRTHQPPVIVLDMMLPKRSGFLVLEEVMKSPSPPAVIMVTANEGRRHMAYAESLGVAAYLTKPIPLQLLIDTICKLRGIPDDDPRGTMST